MGARILFKPKTEKNLHSPGWRPRSQRSKYRVLEMMIEREAVTNEELAELLAMTVQAVSKVTRSLALSGLIAWVEKDGQRMMATDTGIRVWKGLHLDKPAQLECCPDGLDLVQELGSSSGINAG